jgi:uncharacterized membrane protein YkvA (DUF1232 family)
MSDPTFKITFTLDPEDVVYFRRLFRHSAKLAANQDEQKTLRGAKRLLAKVRKQAKTPKFVLEAMSTLDDLLQVIEDADFKPPRAVRKRILGALAYFGNPTDLIPDNIPVFGYLDDALMVKLIEGEFRHELSGFRKFRRWRDGAEQRPWTSTAKGRQAERIEVQRNKLRAEIERKVQRDAHKRGFFR